MSYENTQPLKLTDTPALPLVPLMGSPLQGFFCGDWEQYEKLKKNLIEKNLSPKEYENEIRKICYFLSI